MTWTTKNPTSNDWLMPTLRCKPKFNAIKLENLWTDIFIAESF